MIIYFEERNKLCQRLPIHNGRCIVPIAKLRRICCYDSYQCVPSKRSLMKMSRGNVPESDYQIYLKTVMGLRGYWYQKKFKKETGAVMDISLPTLRKLLPMEAKLGEITSSGNAHAISDICQATGKQGLTVFITPPTTPRCRPIQLYFGSPRLCTVTVLLCKRLTSSYQAPAMNLFSRSSARTSSLETSD